VPVSNSTADSDGPVTLINSFTVAPGRDEVFREFPANPQLHTVVTD
jgi:hypothetical protein